MAANTVTEMIISGVEECNYISLKYDKLSRDEIDRLLDFYYCNIVGDGLSPNPEDHLKLMSRFLGKDEILIKEMFEIHAKYIDIKSRIHTAKSAVGDDIVSCILSVYDKLTKDEIEKILDIYYELRSEQFLLSSVPDDILNFISSPLYYILRAEALPLVPEDMCKIISSRLNIDIIFVKKSIEMLEMIEEIIAQ